MRRMLFLLVALAVAATTFPVSAKEESEKDRPEVIYKKKTVVTFGEGDVIDGSLQKPDGEFVDSRRESRFENLLRVRRDFRDQILDSVYDPAM